MKKGVIYILTNPSFPDYVKIGYADDIQKRLKQLNRSECIPFAFRVYATYEVSSRLSDLKIHAIIDKLNPNLRSIDNFEGQKRVREFYAMSPEDAYSILEALAEIHDCRENLRKWTPTDEDVRAEAIAEEIKAEKQDRSANFSFEEIQIPVGAVLEYVEDVSISCKVVDNRRIEYDGNVMYITPFVRLISGKNWITNGPRFLLDHFMYNKVILRSLYK